MVKITLLSISVVTAGAAFATPYTSNDSQSNAMGNTGVASANAPHASTFNPALLADYNDNVNFGMSALGFKVYVEDPFTLAETTKDFVEVTLDDFDNVDIDAYNTALNGNVSSGGSEQSVVEVFANISTTAQHMVNLGNDIETDANDGSIDQPDNITDLGAENNNLKSQIATLDAKILTVQTQNSNVTILTNNASAGLENLNDRPAQLGLGLDWVNIAFPSKKLGMSVGLSSSISAGFRANVTNNDFDQINNIVADLNEFTTQATAVTTELTEVTDANDGLINVMNQEPQCGDDSAACQAAIVAWGGDIQAQATNIQNQSNDVNNEVTALQSITTTNGTVVNGKLENLDFTMTSEIEIVGASMTDLSFSVAHRFDINNEYVAVGVTPKLQQISIFERTIVLKEADTESNSLSEDPIGYLTDNSTLAYRFNVDAGAAKTWDFHGQLRAGVALKDIVPWNLKTKSGTELEIRPKLRIAAAHQTKFTKLAFDMDLTENKPLRYGVPTRNLSLGGEVNAWGHAALRAGYRNNLSIENSHVISTGIGVTPFGIGIDIAAWTKPEFSDATKLIQDVGVTAQLSVNF
ncbi:MAG: conjugal transfer protein TraF [Reinekea sp.]